MNAIDTDADALKIEQIRHLYRHLPASIIVNLLLASILVAVQYSVIPAPKWFGWLMALCAVLLVRAALLFAWRASAKRDAQFWLNRFRIIVVVTGTIWGVGGIMLSPDGNTAHQVYVAFVLGGLSAGAISSLAIDRVSTMGLVLPALVPFVVYLALQGNSVSLGMSSMSVLFMLFIAASAKVSEGILHENFQLRINAFEDEVRFRAMLEHSPIAARIADIKTNRILFANQSYSALLGVSPDQVVGIEPIRFYARPEEYAAVNEKLDRGEKITDQLMELTLPNSSHKWALATYLRIEYQGRPADLGWFYDITDRKHTEERVQHLAYHDTLTALPNRMLLRDRLQQALTIAERDKTALALMFVDLDRFKSVNDRHGHDAGDLLLKAAAQRIRDCVRKSDSVARIGGDEFIVLLTTIQTPTDALAIAEKVRQSLHRPFMLARHPLKVSASIGVAVYPDHATSDDALINLADRAMYCAKAEGRNNVQLFRPGMECEGRDHLGDSSQA